jgi:hypothetical protein
VFVVKMDEQAPPPPYSETDIYSGTSSHHVLTPETSQADAASESGQTLLSVASSDDETIYTPPGSTHQNQVHEEDLDHVSSSSATAYFDLRPAYNQHTGPIEIYRLAVSHNTDPEDLLYPEALLAKDITEQDWKTFINHLLPDHTAGVNNDVADRKLRAELEDDISHLSLGHDNRSRSDISEAEAQLGPLRSPRIPRAMDRVEATISEWNDGFFNPRGIQISTIDVDAEIAAGEEERTHMPGSWIPWENENNGEPSTSNAGARKGSFFGNFLQAGTLRPGTQGFKMGPIVADNDGFRIGKNGLRADHEGFRIGNLLVADSNGFRLGGSRGLNAGNHGVSFGGRPFNKRDFRRDMKERFRGQVNNENNGDRGRSHSHDRRGKQRQRSASKSSTSSSSSSSGSESSLGSLPDYEDLRDQQLPIAKQSLIAWLSHPDQPITREAVQQAKQDIKNAKREDPRNFNQDMAALRSEVKDLMKRFKSAKKLQKKQRREDRRSRRAEKRALKKERRRERREEHRGGRHGFGCGGRHGRGGPWGMHPGNIPPPTMPGIPTPPPMPNFPFGPNGGPFGRGGPSHGRGGPFGGRGGPFGAVGGPMDNRGVFNGMTSMHGNWPFTQAHPCMPQVPSQPSFLSHDARFMDGLNPVSNSAEYIHAQLSEMSKAAIRNENLALGLRREATEEGLSEKERVRKCEEATMLEEEAETCRREADRLRAEAEAVDRELARELEEEHEREFEGQRSGVVPGAFN